MNPKVLLPLMLLLIGAGLSAQSAELKATVDTGLIASYQDGGVKISPIASNSSVVGEDAIYSSVGVITATIGDNFYGATVSATVGSGTSTLGEAWGWYRPLNWMTISAGTSNPNPFSSVDNDTGGTFASPGVAAIVDVSPLTLGGSVSSQLDKNGNGTAYVNLIGGARLGLEGIGSVNVILGTTETIWLDWYHVSMAVAPLPGVLVNAGYSAETITAAYLDEGNAGLSFAVTPEVGLSGYAQVFQPWSDDHYLAYATTVTWAVAPGLTLSGKAAGQLKEYPNSMGKGTFTYQPYSQVTVTFVVQHDTNPGFAPVAVPRTEASVDFTFSL